MGIDFSQDTMSAIRMRGLPFDVTEKEIFDFFAAYNVSPGAIKIGVNAAGQRTGEAVVLFPTAEDAKRAALEKHGDNIGHRWIELYLIKASQYYSFELRFDFECCFLEIHTTKNGIARKRK